MTIFESSREAFVWMWLPGELEPVVAGKLGTYGKTLRFNYGKSYLERIHSAQPVMPIYEPELPLLPGILPLAEGLSIPGCIRDAAPDAWGRRVIINKVLGEKGAGTDTAVLDELTYLLESGSDRIGALDFQRSPTEYVPRLSTSATLEELLRSSDRVEQGIPLTAELDQALLIIGNNNLSRIKTCLEAAQHFLLSLDEARLICEGQVEIIESHWDAVCEEAKLSEVDKKMLWRRQFLNQFAFE